MKPLYWVGVSVVLFAVALLIGLWRPNAEPRIDVSFESWDRGSGSDYNVTTTTALALASPDEWKGFLAKHNRSIAQIPDFESGFVVAVLVPNLNGDVGPPEITGVDRLGGTDKYRVMYKLAMCKACTQAAGSMFEIGFVGDPASAPRVSPVRESYAAIS